MEGLCGGGKLRGLDEAGKCVLDESEGKGVRVGRGGDGGQDRVGARAVCVRRVGRRHRGAGFDALSSSLPPLLISFLRTASHIPSLYSPPPLLLPIQIHQLVVNISPHHHSSGLPLSLL
jgi:hypothetical protein